jgi:hypothetical protein
LPSRPPKNVQESESAEILTAEQTMATRDWVNQLAGSTRMLGHGQLYTGKGKPVLHRRAGRDHEAGLLEGLHDCNRGEDRLRSNSDMKRWRLDDPDVAYPTYERIDYHARKDHGRYLKSHPGFRNISIHKGLSTNEPEPGRADWATRGTFRRQLTTGRSSTSSSTTRRSSPASGCSMR